MELSFAFSRPTVSAVLVHIKDGTVLYHLPYVAVWVTQKHCAK